MKKYLISIIFILGTLSLFGQNDFKYQLRAFGGISIGGNYVTKYYPVKIDSITSTAGDIKFWSGGAALTAVPGVGSGTWGAITGTLANQIDLSIAMGLKADLISPTFTGTPDVPGYVPTSRTVNGHALTGNVTVTATDVGLGNVTNESKATMFTNPLFTGAPTVPGYVPTSTTVNGHALTGNISVTAADVSLGNVTNESKATMFTSPTFTGTPVIPSPFTLGATSVTANGTELNVLDNIPATLTSTELGYSDGVTSAIQGQIDTKLAKPDSSAIEGKKYATGKMLKDGLGLKLTAADTNHLSDRIDAAGGASWIDSANYYIKEFNIIDFGAVSGDGNSDIAAIQAAIDAAYATASGGMAGGYAWMKLPSGYYGGKVLIPSGEWTIDDTLTIRAHITIQADDNAVMRVPAGYTGSIWRNPHAARCYGTVMKGGYYINMSANPVRLFDFDGNWDDNYYGASEIEISDMVISYFYEAMRLRDDDQNGLCSAIFVHDWITAWCTRLFNIEAGGCSFVNISADGAGADTVIINKSDGNSYNNIAIWDFDHAGQLAAYNSGKWNYFNLPLSNAGAIVDKGTDNVWNEGGRVIAGGGIIAQDNSATSGDGGEVTLRRGGANGGNVAINYELGEINFKGYHTNGFYNGAIIKSIVNNDPGTNDMPANLYIQLSADGSATPTTRLQFANGYAYFTDIPVPTTDGSTDLGIAGREWGNLFLNTGAAVNFENSDVTLTHSSNTLTLAGGNLALGSNSITGTGSLGATGAGKLTKLWAVDGEFTNLPTINGGTMAAAIGFTPASGSLTLSGADALTLTTTNTTNVTLPTSGTLATIQNINDTITARLAVAETSIAGNIIKKTIGWHGATGVDFTLPDSAGIGNHHVDLGALIPAKCRIIAIEIVCTEALTGSGNHEITMEAGSSAGGEQYITALTCDDINNVVGIIKATAVPMNWTTATHVYIGGTPDANWDTHTAGKWTVYITYIKYTNI